MAKIVRNINGILMAVLFASVFLISAAQAKTQTFTVVWSIYAGWMPWDYAGHSKILDKWAQKYGIKIELKKMDYIPSVEAYVAKKADACVMTNMEALDMPAASGISTSAIIMGDFSNGNDALLTRNNIGIKDLKGKDISLVELSVSHYLLVRALEMNGLKENDVRIVNTSDADIAPAFIANKKQEAVVTWNPLVMEIMQQPGIKNVMNSSSIPGEILDVMAVRTEVLQKHPELGKALAGAWYEVMATMSKRGAEADKAMEIMAQAAGCSLTEYKAQLKTTAMYYKAKDAADFTGGSEIKEKMNYVRNFCFSHGLLGENARSVDEVGIQYPDGSVQGDKKNIQLIFDSRFMVMAAEGKLE
ncbi:MAG: ABC transporter substrate-binding protein [Fibrobacteria bacterium]|nr:ABC transporter substrate-binding protein [Fibrobacteria bacterium]